jgi:competence protein ComFC
VLLPRSCAVCGRFGPPLCDDCRSCLPGAPRGTPVPAAIAYDGTGREVVLALKHRGVRALGPALGAMLVPLALAAPGRPALVTWAPTSPQRRRARGFDQAEVLARSLAVRLGVPAAATLGHLPGPSQTGRSRVERLSGSPRFVALGPVRGGVVVVDDVVTTGATLRAARRALRQAGATWAHAVAVAATPA